MLGADRATPAATRFLHSQDQHHFGAWREGHLTDNTLVATRHERFKSVANLTLFDAQGAEHLSTNPFPLVHQSQKQMLGAELMALEVARFFLCLRQRLACQVREPVVELTNQLGRSRMLDDCEEQGDEPIG